MCCINYPYRDFFRRCFCLKFQIMLFRIMSHHISHFVFLYLRDNAFHVI